MYIKSGSKTVIKINDANPFAVASGPYKSLIKSVAFDLLGHCKSELDMGGGIDDEGAEMSDLSAAIIYDPLKIKMRTDLAVLAGLSRDHVKIQVFPNGGTDSITYYGKLNKSGDTSLEGSKQPEIELEYKITNQDKDGAYHAPVISATA